jgi:hypothetical protein
MSRLVVVLLVLLAAPLLGSTCELRASTGKIEHPAPHDGQDGSGVQVVVTTGAQPLAAAPRAGSSDGVPDPTDVVRAALCASVLPDLLPDGSPEVGAAGRGAGTVPVASAGFRVASASLRPAVASISGGVPEPGAARLFALGLALAAAALTTRAHRRRSASRRPTSPFPAAGDRC